MSKKKKSQIKNKPKKVLDAYEHAKKNNLREPKKENKSIKNINLDKKLKTIRTDAVNTEFNKGKQEPVEDIKENKNIGIYEKIQTFISFLFTIIIFILLLFLVFIIYNNYFKPKNEVNKEEVCQEYIKKDYHISKDSVLDYIKNKRSIFYNLDLFDKNNITNDNILTIAKFIIWDSSDEYIRCDGEDNCLTTKKEMNYDELVNEISKFLDKDDINFVVPENQDNNIRFYQKDDKIVLTFSEFEFETLKHEVVDIIIDENNITIYFALSKRIPNSDYYDYVGSKKILLKYIHNDYVLENIETAIK